MSVSTPKISPYTYHDIVVKTEALAEIFTKKSVIRTAEWLVGRTLDQDIVDPTTDTLVALKGTIVDAALAETIAQLSEPELVRIKGWQHPGSVEVAPIRELLIGYILNTKLTDPVTQEIIATSGQVIDAALADQIQTIPDLNRVNIKVQPSGLLVVEPTFEAILNHVLDEDVQDPATEQIIVPRGTLVDAVLAEQISGLLDDQDNETLNPVLVRIRVAPDAGWALIRIFGRLVELVIERLNQVPDKNFLAFLDLIGTQIRPPQPARVPLTFQLAAGSPADAFVPPQTRVAAPAVEGAATETIFETDRDLVVTRSQLKAVFVRDPETDQFSNRTELATTFTEADFPVFEADQSIEHALYLAHDALFMSDGPKNLTLDIDTPDAEVLNALPISWSYWNGLAWRLLSPSPRILEGLAVTINGTDVEIAVGMAVDGTGRQIEIADPQSLSLADQPGEPLLVMLSWNAALGVPALQLVLEAEVADYPDATYIQLARLTADETGAYLIDFTATAPNADLWQIEFNQLPPLVPKMINGLEAGWLRAHFDVPWPKGAEENIGNGRGQRRVIRQGLFPAVMLVGSTIQEEQPFFPFGSSESPQFFYLSLPEAFIRPNAEISIDLSLVEAGNASADLTLNWSYWNGAGWQLLGRSNRNNDLLPPRDFDFVDGTQVLTQAGTVTFSTPPGWAQHELYNLMGYWLRVQVLPGNYGIGQDLQPPQVESLLIAYAWEIPQIETIQASLTTHETGLIPEMGLANSVALDLSSNFYPFGERPRVGDIFYLNSPLAFSKPGAAIELDITLSNPLGSTPDPPLAEVNPSASLQIAWEVWDGQRWFQLGLSSTTIDDDLNEINDPAAFTNSGIVTFTLPNRLGPGLVIGESGYWLRARIVQGNYGRDAYYEPVSGTDPVEYSLILADYGPPLIESLTVNFTYAPPAEPVTTCLTYNDFFFVDCTGVAQETETYFEPFVATADTRPAYYLGFDRPFANRAMTLYAKVKPALYDDSILAARQNNDPAQIKWEFASPTGWTTLGVNDETRAFAERGLISFVGPKNFAPRQEFGQPLYWLRARWDSGRFVAMPHLHYLLTNTTWASQAATLRNEVLGSSNGEPDQIFQFTQAPVLVEQQIEVREFELPSGVERAALEAEEGTDAITIVEAAAGRQAEIWVRWHHVPDFHGSGSRDRHYVFDPLTGTVYFGNGQYGMVPPQGRNNIRARRYRIGGGDEGNRPAQTIIQLKSTVPYVDGTTNYEAASGGADEETLEQVKERGPRVLRHRGRAVAAQDFADLAREASPDVVRARAITPQYDPFDQEWISPHTEENAGQVGLIIVPNSTEAQPIPDLELLNRVESYILDRCVPTLDLWVAGPDWVEVWVEAVVVPVSLEAANTLETTIIATLQEFIHPLTGGLDGDGWVFGREPYESDMYHLIESIDGVDYIRSLTLHKAGIETARPNRFLIYSGAHQISLVS